MTTAQSSPVAERYRLIRQLGEGGMGRVWLAHDEVLHREVAVKEVVPPVGLTADEQHQSSARYLREARAIARLNNPNVVRVFDVVTREQWPWIVMEYVPSRSLQQVINEDGPLPPAQVARIGLAVLSALTAAHRAGILHRDVKPANVLLGEQRVVLTDFGLATMEGEAAVTRSGMIIGSPAYMAPERAREGVALPASDLWSLGATLYTAVEGRTPYERGSTIATLTALATEEPDPPTRAGPLVGVLRGLLDKDPATRLTAADTGRLLREVAGLRARRPVSWPAPNSAGVPTSSAPGRAAAGPVPTAVPAADPVPGPAPAAPGGSEPDGSEPGPPAPPPGAAGPDAGGPHVVRLDSLLGAPPADPQHTLVARGALLPAERRPGRHTALLVAVACVVALAVAGLAAYVLRSPGTPHKPAPSSRPAGAAAPHSAAPRSTGPGPSPTGTGLTAGAALPAGWHYYHDPTGFTVAVPDGWQISRAGSIVYFREPNGQRLLGIDQTTSPKPDPVADWTGQEQYRVAHGDFPGYQRIRIAPVNYHIRAADWEFSYDSDGGRTHVVNRGAIFASDLAYGFYWSTPDADWAANLPNFTLITSTFRGRS